MTTVPSTRDLAAIRIWLLVVAGLIALMVLVGGATRLTESGLSIVEWKPVTGFHSTIDSPDSVSRVAPPTSTMIAISAATPASHQRTARGSVECSKTSLIKTLRLV